MREHAAALPGLEVFPNPASRKLSARVAGGEPLELELLDLLGRRVSAGGTPAVEATLSVEGLAGSCYLLRATLPDGRQVTRRVTVVD